MEMQDIVPQWPVFDMEPPEMYVYRLYEALYDIPSLLRLVLALDADRSEATPMEINTFEAILTKARAKGIIPFGREGENMISYPVTSILKLLSLFVVTQARDVENAVHKELMADVILNNLDGPLVVKEGMLGYGLMAERDYARGEIITAYGGMTCSQDKNSSFLLGTSELQQRGTNYSFSLYQAEDWRDDAYKLEHMEDWTLDGYLHFRLEEKGRWANTLRNAEENNAEAELVVNSQRPEPPFRSIRLRAVQDIQKGEFIHFFYGEAYPEEFFGEEESESKRPRLMQCIGCGVHCIPNDTMEEEDVVPCTLCGDLLVDIGMSARKAKEILSHGKVRGRTLTKKQRGLFGIIASGKTPKKKKGGRGRRKK